MEAKLARIQLCGHPTWRNVRKSITMIPQPYFAIGLPHGSEWLIILVLAVLFFGADKLPKLAKGLGKSLGEFKKAKEDFEKEVHAAASEPEVKKPEQQNLISGNVPAPITPVTPVMTATSVMAATPVDELTKKS